MSNENTQNLASKIARLLQDESQNTDFLRIQESIEKINQRLDGIENKLNTNLSLIHI